MSGPRYAPPFGAVNLRGLWTLYRRGLWRHVKFWIESLAGPCVSSLLFLTVFVLARSTVVGPVWPGISVASFVAPGLIAFGFCHAAFQTIGMYMVYDKMEGILQDVLSAPLTSLEMTLGWILGAASGGLATGAAILLVFLPFVDWPVLNLPLLLLFAVLGSLLFASVGLLVGLWARKWDHFSAAETFMMLPLGLLSGTFFVRDDLPPLGGDLLTVNPVFHVIDGFRSALLGRADGDLVISALLLIGLTLLCFLLCWHLVRRGWHLKP